MPFATRLSRWTLAVLLAASLPLSSNPGIRAAAPAPPAPPTADDAAQPTDPPAPDEPQPKDPSDVRNAIGDLALIRGMQKLSKPLPPGLWSDLVNQPYFT